ncbi:MAG: acyl-CoA dehydrogenase family protein, partial [Marmoricola sp.]
WPPSISWIGRKVTPSASIGHRMKEIAVKTGQIEDPLVASQIIELENELLALELTALRVVASSADGKPHPASSVLKLKGTELQQAVSELQVDLGGTLSLASGADEGSGIPDWARVAVPTYLNLRKASIYGGSNEIQRQIIAGTILGL